MYYINVLNNNVLKFIKTVCDQECIEMLYQPMKTMWTLNETLNETNEIITWYLAGAEFPCWPTRTFHQASWNETMWQRAHRLSMGSISTVFQWLWIHCLWPQKFSGLWIICLDPTVKTTIFIGGFYIHVCHPLMCKLTHPCSFHPTWAVLEELAVVDDLYWCMIYIYKDMLTPNM